MINICADVFFTTGHPQSHFKGGQKSLPGSSSRGERRKLGSFGFRSKVDAIKMSQWILFGKWIGVFIIIFLLFIHIFSNGLKHTLIYRCELQYVIAGGVGVYAPSTPPAPSLGNACMMTDRCLLQVGVCDPIA